MADNMMGDVNIYSVISLLVTWLIYPTLYKYRTTTNLFSLMIYI